MHLLFMVLLSMRFLAISGTNMVRFILTNPHIRNVDFDDNTTLWFEKFDDRCNTSVIVHGWHNSAEGGVFEAIADAYNLVPATCFNTVRVSWPEAMRDEYAAAVAALPLVANEVAAFLRRMQRLELVRHVELVGFSLGAHLVGLVGRALRTSHGQPPFVAEIVALDPAGPGFTTGFYGPFCEHTLQMADARVVVTLATNAGCLGTSQRLGTVNFIANDGSVQAGCARFDCICSHHKALQYFIESLTSDAFFGRSHSAEAIFGRGRNELTPPGDYTFRTNFLSPYARGRL